MKQITVRNVPDDLARALDAERHRRKQSLNHTVLELLCQALGLGTDGRLDNGLGDLAGTWSEEEFSAFQANTVLFEQVDEDLWR